MTRYKEDLGGKEVRRKVQGESDSIPAFQRGGRVEQAQPATGGKPAYRKVQVRCGGRNSEKAKTKHGAQRDRVAAGAKGDEIGSSPKLHDPSS